MTTVFNLMILQKRFKTSRKHGGKRRVCLKCFKRLVLQTRKNQNLFGKGLTMEIDCIVIRFLNFNSVFTIHVFTIFNTLSVGLSVCLNVSPSLPVFLREVSREYVYSVVVYQKYLTRLGK